MILKNLLIVQMLLITLITKDKQSLKSSITRKSLKKLNLKVNDEVKALIKTVSIF